MWWVPIGAAVLAALWLVALIVDAAVGVVTGTYEHWVRLPKVSGDTFALWFGGYVALVGITGLVVGTTQRLRLVFNMLIWLIAAIVVPFLLLTLPVSYTSVSGDVHCGSYHSWNDSTAPLNDVCVDKLESRTRWALTVGAIGLIGPIAWLYVRVRNEERPAAGPVEPEEP